MSFKELITNAQSGDSAAIEQLLKMYHPLLIKESIVEGVFDEDLYQELCFRFLYCIKKFHV